jgi:hypothetical protein
MNPLASLLLPTSFFYKREGRRLVVTFGPKPSEVFITILTSMTSITSLLAAPPGIQLGLCRSHHRPALVDLLMLRLSPWQSTIPFGHV